MAQNQDLEKHYDVIVTSTDLTSSLVAAAASRSGKKILHLDPYDHYGQEWSAMKLFEVLAAQALLPKEYSSLPQALPGSVISCIPPSLISNVHLDAPVFESREACRQFLADFSKNSSDAADDDRVERFRSEFYPKLKEAKTAEEARVVLAEIKEELSCLNILDNAFSVDLTPRFIFSLGQMVDILIRSNVTRYLEFRKIARILTPLIKRDTDKDSFSPGSTFKLINVPCTRSDVFTSTTISMVEKRLLMRFLDFIKTATKNPEQQYTTMPFSDCLAEQKLTPKLRDLIVNSVLMDKVDITTADALCRINRFMSAIGRFADRPYLIPTYGTDDLVQAFCRYAAIYGATYCLKTLITGVILNDDDDQKKCTAVRLGEKATIECDHVVSNYRFAGTEEGTPKKMISRAILCSRESICLDGLGEYDNTSVLYLPADMVGSKSPVYVFETDKSTNACPKGLYIQYFWCDTNTSALADLKPIIEQVYSAKIASSANSGPLWSLYFNQSYNSAVNSTPIARNLHHVSPPINELDFDFVVQEARAIFEAMYPEEEFFPQTKEPNGKDDEEDEDEAEEEEAGEKDTESAPETVEKTDTKEEDQDDASSERPSPSS